MRAIALAMLAALALVAPRLHADTLTVFAAASLADAMADTAAAWQAETGHEVRISAAGSSALARQIRAGAPADVFVSANPAWMAALAEDDRLVPGTRRELLGNSLVLIAPAAADPAPVALADLPARLGEGRLAMALVDAVPAGQYGRAALEHLGLWAALAPRVAQAANVRAALQLVALGEAAFGIVYATDAAVQPLVRVVAEVPPDSHPPIRYPAAAVAGGDAALAGEFLDFLQGARATAIFRRHGFSVPD